MNTYCKVAEVQLKYKPKTFSETIRSSSEINRLLKEKVFDEGTIGYKEYFKILLFNQANMLIGYSTISEGGLNSTTVDVRVIMQTALVSNAISIVIAHNHPSGTIYPSVQDDDLTRKIKSACDVMGIRLLDHIIVTPYNRYYSYCDNNRL
ncbi:MAG: JAB domain-containing protein [Muribaculaceae bacterium]|nr:JAB domain-containing protein [Muribaculaceae bacterium]